jgi:hypothetical protein
MAIEPVRLGRHPECLESAAAAEVWSGKKGASEREN